MCIRDSSRRSSGASSVSDLGVILPTRMSPVTYTHLEEGTLQPPFVYIFSHGDQDARLAGRFNRNREGVVMSGLNGFRLLLSDNWK